METALAAAREHFGDGSCSIAEVDIPVSPNATYLITGGLGGFGLEVARRLAYCGAKHLVLCGRSGASTPTAQKTVFSLKSEGVEVVVEQVDVTDEVQVASMLDRINASMPPLRGIVHGAMVLDDVPIVSMKDEQLERVLNPKHWEHGTFIP